MTARGVALPTSVVEPSLARFLRLAEASHDTDVIPAAGEPDPRVQSPCPAWCQVQHDSGGHALRISEGQTTDPAPTHRSRPVVIPFYGQTAALAGGTMRTPSLEVFLSAHAPMPWGKPARTLIAMNYNYRTSDNRIEQLTIPRMVPTEARALIEALSAALALTDPDGDFDQAHPNG